MRLSLYFLISSDPCFLAWQLVAKLIFTIFLLIITLCFTCDKREICSTIKKSQNIMNMIVGFSQHWLANLQTHLRSKIWVLKVLYSSAALANTRNSHLPLEKKHFTRRRNISYHTSKVQGPMAMHSFCIRDIPQEKCKLVQKSITNNFRIIYNASAVIKNKKAKSYWLEFTSKNNVPKSFSSQFYDTPCPHDRQLDSIFEKLS